MRQVDYTLIYHWDLAIFKRWSLSNNRRYTKIIGSAQKALSEEEPGVLLGVDEVAAGGCEAEGVHCPLETRLHLIPQSLWEITNNSQSVDQCQ